MKKSISTILSMSIAVGLLAGCSTNDSKETAPKTNVETETTQQAETKPEAIDTSFIKNKQLDIKYGNQSEAQKLDIYWPNEGEGPFPVIIAIHGGGFMQGDKTGTDLTAMIEGVNHGYAVVAVNYRLSGEAIFPAAISDIKAAIRYVKANAKEYNMDSEKVVAWGGSAGGNLAALIGTSGDSNSLNGENPENMEYTSEVQAVVDWYGQIDFLKLDEQFKESGITSKMGERSAADSPESKYIGGNITENIEQVEKANPTTYITKNDPAFFIQHGTADPNVPTQQSIDFSEKLIDVLGDEKVELTLLEGAVHGGQPFNSEENLQEVFGFLDRVLK
ncbi:alpha/beta hydrolase fold domain-containing protein [Psychrobacillus sp. NPDC096389]|uniref:alpha/beta hydrolase fold domain-containing protein n=1 Tax=Psychrobacillus sp. NPDC096389 TaxID=3364490 RepID=UPI0037FFEDD6